MKLKFNILLLLPSVTLAQPHLKPSYELGISAAYAPDIDANQSLISTSAGINVPLGKDNQFNVSADVDINYSSQVPTGVVDNVPKVSGYKSTDLNLGVGYQVSKSVNISVFGTTPLHTNKKFGGKRDYVAYGGGIQWQDSENFAVQAHLAKTHYKKQNNGVHVGNVVNAGIKAKLGFSQKAELYLGANYRKQKAATQTISGKTRKLNRKSSGVGAVFGVNYHLDHERRHGVKFEMQSAIGDLGGQLTMAYRYVF